MAETRPIMNDFLWRVPNQDNLNASTPQPRGVVFKFKIKNPATQIPCAGVRNGNRLTRHLAGTGPITTCGGGPAPIPPVDDLPNGHSTCRDQQNPRSG